MAGEVISAPSMKRPLRKPALAPPAPRALGGMVEQWLEAERDQLGLWLPVGLGLGIAAWFALPDAGAWRAFLALSGGGAALALAFDRGGRLARATGIFLLAAVLGCLLAWARSDRVAAPRLARPTIARVAGSIDEVDPLPARGKVRLVVALDPAPGLPPRARINVDAAKASRRRGPRCPAPTTFRRSRGSGGSVPRARRWGR